MALKKNHIIFIKISHASFIRNDEHFLREKYHLHSYNFRFKKGVKVLFSLFHEFWFTLYHIWKSKLIFIWFADYHAVIPAVLGRLLNKKVVLVVGGFDAADEKKLGYGVKTRLIGRLSAGISFRMATHLLPVTKFTRDDLFKNFGQHLSVKSEVIYNCYNDQFNCDDLLDKKDEVTTICLAYAKNTVLRKGVDFFVKLAKEFPDKTFNVIGLMDEALQYLASFSPPNVKLIQKIPFEEVQKILCQSKIICQFSRYEAFGVALLEGISAGCFPVGLNYGGTREILINDIGIMIDQLDIVEGKKALEEAFKKTPMDVYPIQLSINERFNYKVRREKLYKLIDNLIG